MHTKRSHTCPKTSVLDKNKHCSDGDGLGSGFTPTCEDCGGTFGELLFAVVVGGGGGGGGVCVRVCACRVCLCECVCEGVRENRGGGVTGFTREAAKGVGGGGGGREREISPTFGGGWR